MPFKAFGAEEEFEHRSDFFKIKEAIPDLKFSPLLFGHEEDPFQYGWEFIFNDIRFYYFDSGAFIDGVFYNISVSVKSPNDLRFIIKNIDKFCFYKEEKYYILTNSLLDIIDAEYDK